MNRCDRMDVLVTILMATAIQWLFVPDLIALIALLNPFVRAFVRSCCLSAYYLGRVVLIRAACLERYGAVKARAPRSSPTRLDRSEVFAHSRRALCHSCARVGNLHARLPPVVRG